MSPEYWRSLEATYKAQAECHARIARAERQRAGMLLLLSLLLLLTLVLALL